MPGWVWAIIIVAVVLIALAVAWSALRRRRSAALQQRFGPEYERTLDARGGRRAAERDLEHRAERRERLDIRPLAPAARERYAAQWSAAQQRFVDDPDGAIRSADALVGDVMRERGYPVDEDFDRRAADVSVDHPHLVENYRGAHAIAARAGREPTSTEDQRQAMVHFRGLFDELLGDGAGDRGRDGGATAAYAAGEEGATPPRG
jgi:hypothetical protein